MAEKRKVARKPPLPDPRKWGPSFGPINYAVMAAGVVAIVAGYVLLDGGSVTAAPLFLVLGYGVLLPAGIIIGWGSLGSDGDDRRA